MNDPDTPDQTEAFGDEDRIAGTPARVDHRDGAEPSALKPGDCVGRYTIRALLGAGGMGQVFSAFDPQLGRTVALKLINPERLRAPQTRARFLREAQAMARLSHPNVVTVFDAGKHGEQIFVAMELVEGMTLAGWTHAKPRTWRQVRDVFLAAGRGLEAAHAAGLVHRDFKPQNVIVANGRVVVLDFGLARVEGEDDPAEVARGDTLSGADALSVSVTITGELLGTPRYMAPEQLSGRPATAKSDQFAFCVSLFEGLYGRPPFAGNSVGELTAATVLGAVDVPARASVPRFLAAAVVRGLQADPERRHPTMSALLAQLGRDPGRALRRGLLAGGAVVAVAASLALAWSGGKSSRPSCTGVTAALEERWDPARRQAIASAFATLPDGIGKDAWRRAEQQLDGWAARWRTQRVDVCESEHGAARPSPLVASRAACLERRLGELDGLLGLLGAPDTTVAQYAASAAHALTPPEICLGAQPAGVEGSLPPASIAALGQARAHLDKATSFRRLGKPRPGLAEATGAAVEADAIGWPPFTAEAQLELGAAQLAVRATDAAGDAYYRALWSAEIAGDDRLRFEATLGLERVDVEASSFVQAVRTLETASAIDRRLPGDADRRVRLALFGARLASMRGQFRECVTRGTEAIGKAEQAAGPESPEVASALMTVGECHAALGENDIARALLPRALAISEKVNGHDFPQTSNLLSDIALLERDAGQLDDALRDSKEVLAIREQLYGPESPDCAAARNNLANLLVKLHRYDEARNEVDHAIAIWTTAWSPESPAVAVGLGTRGSIAMAEGHPATAEPDYRRALEIRRKKRGANHPETVTALRHLAAALEPQGKREAITLLEEALAAAERDKDTDVAGRANLRFLLGQARFALGVDRAGGLALATSACQELATVAAKEPLAECQAWLAHPVCAGAGCR